MPQMLKDSNKKWDVFISHASEDKKSIVKKLATILQEFGVRVWYDEFTLKIGDSLSKKIDEGLIDSNFGIVIISESFLNKKWPDYEYRSLLSKEDNFKKVILPIWHNVTNDLVTTFSLYLSDKYALDTTKDDVRTIALKITEVVRPDIHENIYRSLLYKKLLSKRRIKQTKVSNIQPGPLRRTTLPKNLLNRIKAFYYNIGKNFYGSFEGILNGFLRDVHPEREIRIWEIMNATYLEYLERNKPVTAAQRRDVARNILSISMGRLDEDTKLSYKQLKKLIAIYETNHTRALE